MVTLTEADNGKTEDIAQGTRFAVQLKENPTTGFQWNATVSPALRSSLPITRWTRLPRAWSVSAGPAPG